MTTRKSSIGKTWRAINGAGVSIVAAMIVFTLSLCMPAFARDYSVSFDANGGTKEIVMYRTSTNAEYDYSTYTTSGVYNEKWIDDVLVHGSCGGVMGWHSLIRYENGVRGTGLSIYITVYDGYYFGLKVTVLKNTTGLARSFKARLNRWDTLEITQARGSEDPKLAIIGSSPIEYKGASYGYGYYCQLGTTLDAPWENVSASWTLVSGSEYATFLTSSDGGCTLIPKKLTSDGTVVIKATYSKNGLQITQTRSITVKADVQKVSVSFNTGGGNYVSSQEYTVGETYGSLPTPSKAGCDFAGWYTSSSYGTRVYSSSTVSANVTTLYAKWTTAVQTSNVGFNPNGGTLSGGNFGAKNGTAQTATLTLTYGKSVYNAGMRAARGAGYAFNGFWTAASGGSQIYDANGKYVPNSLCWTSSGTWKHTGNAMLYAQWHTHTVKFDPNGGTLSGGNFGAKNGTSQVATLQVTCGAGAYNSGMRAVLSKTGYVFNGFWTATTGGSQIYDANGKYVPNSRCWTADGKWRHHGNAALYARWALDEGFRVSFNPNGGTLSGGNFGAKNGTAQTAIVTMTYGKGAYNSGMRATRSGYMFMGWWTATSGGSQIYDASGRYKPNSRCWTSDGRWQHSGNAALYARWLPITTGGNANWAMLSDGSWKSGTIGNSQSTWLQTTVNGAGTLTFHWKASCEWNDSYDWDFLEWTIEGIRQGKIGERTASGTWKAVSLRIDGSGTHTIRWNYRKDGSNSDGSDCGWIRNVYWSGSVQ